MHMTNHAPVSAAVSAAARQCHGACRKAHAQRQCMCYVTGSLLEQQAWRNMLFAGLLPILIIARLSVEATFEVYWLLCSIPHGGRPGGPASHDGKGAEGGVCGQAAAPAALPATLQQVPGA